MSEPVTITMKRKLPDGSFEIQHPVTSVNNVTGLKDILDDKIGSDDIVTESVPNKIVKLDSQGLLPSEVLPKTVEFISYTMDDIN